MSRTVRRIVGALVVTGITACAGAIMVGTALAAPFAAKTIPHSVDGYWGYNCTICHQVYGGMVAMGPSHGGYTSSDCMTCHTAGAPAPAAAPAPAPAAPAPADAAPAPAPAPAAAPAAPAAAPAEPALPADHAGRPASSCAMCHPGR